MKPLNFQIPADDRALQDSLSVASNKHSVTITDADEKMLRIVLTLGDSDTRISSEGLKTWFLDSGRQKPTTYFARLAPGLVQQLMQLGGILEINDSVTFEIGPGQIGKGGYRTKIDKMHVHITIDQEKILIKSRKLKES